MVRLLYIFKLILRGFRHRPWGSLLTLVACWFALSQLAIVLYTVEFANRATLMPGTTSSMIAYLKQGQSDAHIKMIQEKIALMDEVAGIEFIPRRSGLERMRQWLGSDNPLLEGLDPEILPDAYEIKIKRQYAIEIKSIADRLRQIQEIEDVRYNRGIIGYIAGSFYTICVTGLLIGIIVIVCLGLVIFLSIRVGIVSRKQEVEVLSLLGANVTFLYGPYLIEACAYGLIGSFLALISTQALIHSIRSHIPALFGIFTPMGIYQELGVIFFACLCCISGAVLAIKRSIDV